MKTIRKFNRIGSEDYGILIKEIINSSKTTYLISSKKYVKFDKNDIDEYKRKMNYLTKENILNENCQYEDNVWHGLDDTQNKYFDFSDFEYNSEISNALKCFIITQLFDRRISIIITGLRLSEVKKMIKMTNNYDEKYMPELVKYIEGKNNNNISDFKFGNTAFLYFNPINNYKEYLNQLAYINASHKIGENVRVIPPYKSIVWFDYILTDFMKSSDLKLIKKYYPIFLWWRISTVIPIRPSEFIKFKRDCCTLNDKDKIYYIKVPRTKLPPNPISKRRVIPLITKLKVTEEIRGFIDDYIKLMGTENQSYLISLRAYSDTFHKDEYMYDAHIVKERITYDNFRNILDNFYEEIVSGRYGYNIVKGRDDITEYNEHNTLVKLKLGDTRHLAFCSMMLQGFNPLTIAQMGGHETLVAQNQYVGHLDEFIDAHSLMLAKYIKSNINRNNDNLNDFFTSEDKRQITNKYFDDIKPRSIDGGLCYSKDFPQSCIDKDCIFCDFFQFDFTQLSNTTYLEMNDNLSIIKSEIKIKVDFLKRYYVDIIKDGSINLKDLKCSDNVQQELIKQSKSLSILVNKKAKLLAYMERINDLK